VLTVWNPMLSFREVLLTVHAGRLVAAAQPIRQGRAVPLVLEQMCRLRAHPSSVDVMEGHLAVERAAARLGRLGLVNTCLIRSLALSALLADQDDVQLHLGFRPSSSPKAVLAGHAWVTLDHRAIPNDSATLAEGQPCEEVAVLTARRPKTSRGNQVRS